MNTVYTGMPLRNLLRPLEQIAAAVMRDDAAVGARARAPLLVLASSSLLVLLVIFQYRYARRWGIPTPWLFEKEGPLEDFTYLAGLLAAVLMAIAARRAWKFEAGALRLLLGLSYAGCALLLLVVAMEEIGWGQQLLHFATPRQWAEINHQQETTLHNLVDRETLTSATRHLACLFAASAVFLSVLGACSKNRYIAAIAPHPSLVPLAIAIAYAGLELHAEIIEAFIALYFLYYSYRAKNLYGRSP